MDDKINVEEMNDFQVSRWLALYEAVNLIADKAEENGKKFDVIHLKPKAIDRCVNHNADIIYRKLTGTIQRKEES